MRDFLPEENFVSPDFSHIPDGARVLVALSGGADSVALLLAMRQTSHQSQREIIAAHVNHGLRGQESDEDENFVVDLCGELQIEIVTRRVKVEKRGEKFSENAARIARYAALIEIAREKHCSVIATGHTANDVLETVILNLARGATVGGLAGIAPYRVLEVGLCVVRPILGVTRNETENFCRQMEIAWRDDSSNADLRLKRNLVRHEIAPLLGEVGNKTSDVLARQTARAADLWRDDLHFLDNAAQKILRDLQLPSRAGILALDGALFRELATAMQRRVLRLAAQRVLDSATSFSATSFPAISFVATSFPIFKIGANTRTSENSSEEVFLSAHACENPKNIVSAPRKNRETENVADFLSPEFNEKDAVFSATPTEISSAAIEEVRLWILENRRRRVWQWRSDLSIEWTGAMSGNRVRVWHVETKAENARENSPSLL